MMIATAVGMLVLLAVSRIFSNNLDSVYLQSAFARVQENGRIATELVSRDIRSADYWGCMGDINSINSVLDTDDEDYDASWIPIGSAIAGVNNASSQAISTINVKNGTDILTLRGSSSVAGVKVETPYMNDTSAAIQISKDSGIEQGQLVLISDCSNADLLSVANANPDSGTLVHNAAPINVDGAVDNFTKELSKSYDGSAQILMPFTKQFFIGENSSGSYSLYRSVNGVASELVRNINDMQLIYGEDTSNNGSADTFSDAGSVSNMDNVVSIRVTLTSESGASISAASMQRDYQFTTNIRNRTL